MELHGQGLATVEERQPGSLGGRQHVAILGCFLHLRQAREAEEVTRAREETCGEQLLKPGEGVGGGGGGGGHMDKGGEVGYLAVDMHL